MKRIRSFFNLGLALPVLLFLTSNVLAQIEVGDFTIRGEAEIGGMLRHRNGDRGSWKNIAIYRKPLSCSYRVIYCSKKKDLLPGVRCR